MTRPLARGLVFGGITLVVVALLIPKKVSHSAFHNTVERWVGPPEVARARSFFDLMSDGQVDRAFAMLAPELRQGDSTRAQLQVFADLVSGLTLDSMMVIGVTVDERPAVPWRHISFQGWTQRGWITYALGTRGDKDGKEIVTAANVHFIPGSLVAGNRFSLRGRSFAHYVWLGCMVLAPLTCVTAFATVVTATGMPKRWLWSVAPAVCAPTFMLNWATGASTVESFQFLVLGVSYVQAGPASPWIVGFGIPIGAFVAIARYMQWKKQASTTEEAPVAAA